MLVAGLLLENPYECKLGLTVDTERACSPESRGFVSMHLLLEPNGLSISSDILAFGRVLEHLPTQPGDRLVATIMPPRPTASYDTSDETGHLVDVLLDPHLHLLGER